MPFWAGIGLDTLDQRAGSVAAVIHGIIFGRVAPSSQPAPGDHRPALVVGHPADPIHPFADAAMLAEEMPNAEFVRARSVLEWRVRARPADRDAAELRARAAGRRRAARAGPARLGALRLERGRMDAVPLYRDEAIVLRTHKLGEADRIITLLTRQHGRVRAVAKGVRKTTSRWGSRLEPFTHVDLQLAEGRNLDVVTQADTHRRRSRRGSATTTTATPPAP